MIPRRRERAVAAASGEFRSIRRLGLGIPLGLKRPDLLPKENEKQGTNRAHV
jgi:hypothetical protein